MFSKRRQEAHVSIQIQNETSSQRLSDRQFRLTHITQSRNYDYHKLQMTLNIYRLGTSFSEVVSSGRDDMLQLGHEESYSKFKDEMGTLGEQTVKRGETLMPTPHSDSRLYETARNRFDTVTMKFLHEAATDMEVQRGKLQMRQK